MILSFADAEIEQDEQNAPPAFLKLLVNLNTALSTAYERHEAICSLRDENCSKSLAAPLLTAAFWLVPVFTVLMVHSDACWRNTGDVIAEGESNDEDGF